MRKLILIISLVFGIAIHTKSQSLDSIAIRRIYNTTLAEQKSSQWLGQLCLNIGHRLSGSQQAEQAVNWADSLMNSLSFDVYKQECMVPVWVRGAEEQAWIISGNNKIEVPVLALGGSISTPPNGIRGKIVEVKNFEELDKLADLGQVNGKIVFYNTPMDQTKINTFEAYGEAVRYRWAGAIRAAGYGAIGAVVRSVTTALDDIPHTGTMGYSDTIKKIPSCAISSKGAETLSRLRRGNPNLEFLFQFQTKTHPDAKSYNVIGELKGTEKPDEIIVVGGHLDSWDVGQGAHDDGAGCVQAIEALYVLKSLGIPLKRTVRAVMFMNEENGSRGGKKFAEVAKLKNEKIIAAIESDAGGHVPRGFGFKGDSAKVAAVMKYKELFTPYMTDYWKPGYGGEDIRHLEDLGTLLIGFHPDSQRYFDYHHSANDTFDKVNSRELALGSATMAALIFLISQYGVD
ncbi:MAG: M20/M25/M40 family metallo-hydrolase [Bacteroidia bacterium]|nr:M20/M25/M40 family metallo-hydrolase [Bacteroidia bacterium]MCZ2276487.1 M20/M25/M40 family metallo-hydrolase [Bacteroidia bacterium]